MHEAEDNLYIKGLRRLADAEIINAFILKGPGDLKRARSSSADTVLLNAGMDSARTFDWSLPEGFSKDYNLSGGLSR